MANGPCWSPFTTACHVASPPASGDTTRVASSSLNWSAPEGAGASPSPRTRISSPHFLHLILKTFLPWTLSSAIEYLALQLWHTIFIVSSPYCEGARAFRSGGYFAGVANSRSRRLSQPLRRP